MAARLRKHATASADSERPRVSRSRRTTARGGTPGGGVAAIGAVGGNAGGIGGEGGAIGGAGGYVGWYGGEASGRGGGEASGRGGGGVSGSCGCVSSGFDIVRAPGVDGRGEARAYDCAGRFLRGACPRHLRGEPR